MSYKCRTKIIINILCRTLSKTFPSNPFTPSEKHDIIQISTQFEINSRRIFLLNKPDTPRAFVVYKRKKRQGKSLPLKFLFQKIIILHALLIHLSNTLDCSHSNVIFEVWVIIAVLFIIGDVEEYLVEMLFAVTDVM